MSLSTALMLTKLEGAFSHVAIGWVCPQGQRAQVTHPLVAPPPFASAPLACRSLSTPTATRHCFSRFHTVNLIEIISDHRAPFIDTRALGDSCVSYS